MAYLKRDEASLRIPMWSNPAVNFNGVPSGTIERENEAGVINTTAPIVAKFH
jgi:hypothetical protein